MNPFQQQVQQQQLQQQQLQQQQLQQQQQQQAAMMNMGMSLAAPYSGFPAMASTTGMNGSSALGAPFGAAYGNGFQSYSPSGGSPVPFGQPQQQQQQQQQQQLQGLGGGFGGSAGGIQPQPTGFDMFANGMMPAHLRQQQQQQQQQQQPYGGGSNAFWG